MSIPRSKRQADMLCTIPATENTMLNEMEVSATCIKDVLQGVVNALKASENITHPLLAELSERWMRVYCHLLIDAPFPIIQPTVQTPELVNASITGDNTIKRDEQKSLRTARDDKLHTASIRDHDGR